MTVGALIVIAVLVILFMCVVAGLTFLGFKAFTHLQASFFTELRQMNAAQSAERQASQEAYAQFMDAQEAREQILAEVDEKWMKTPDSEIAYDDDLTWEEARDG